MVDILTLAQARAALNWAEGQYIDRDGELEDTYIPTVTETIEAWCGRMADRRETWRSDDPSPLTTPWVDATIKSVSVNSSPITGYSYASGVLTIADPAYRSGDVVTVVATGLPIPATIIRAAGIVLAHLWNADKQGRAGGSEVRGEASDPTPRGFAIPRRAEQLLEPYRIIGGSSWGPPYQR